MSRLPETIAVEIRAITFDLDDTFWDVWAIIDRAEQALQGWLALHFPRVTERYSSLDLRNLCAVISAAHPELAHDRSGVRRMALARAAESVGYGDFPVEEAFEVFFEVRNRVEYFDDVQPALAALRGRYRLAALTNGNACIRRTGLERYLDFAITASEVGAPKPDPTMFRAAAQRLEVAPQGIVHVGDHPEHDVAGAAAAGYRTVWLNRDGRQRWPGEFAAPDAEIRHLGELAPVLGRLVTPAPAN